MGLKKIALSDIAVRKPVISQQSEDDQQILCKTHLPVEKATSPSDFRTTSEYVLKTVALGLGRPQGSCQTSTNLFHNPLRLILARTPISETIWSGTHETLYFLDTLDCGHQVYVFPQNFLSGKKRHRCLVCGEAQLALKFPAQSVISPRKKKIA